MCGAPCDEDGDQLKEIPDNYNPNDYEHKWCNSCAQENENRNEERRVTSEMASDAGDPTLEGTLY